MSGTARPKQAQAWIELKADDPAAVSALGVARARLAAGRTLAHLRRYRVIELQGVLPAVPLLATHLHASTWFFNPHKETCVLRTGREDPLPPGARGEILLIAERGGARRPAAERWWRHAVGGRITVREGVAWALEFSDAAGAAAHAEALLTVRDQAHGLFANPHAQRARRAGAEVPLTWLAEAEQEGT